MAEQVVHNIRENNYERFALSGLVIIDNDLCGTKIAGVPVVANEENAAAYVCREFAVTVKHVLLVELFSVLYLFTMQEGQAYSRTALYLTGVIYAILTYIVRIIWKKILRSRMDDKRYGRAGRS